MARRPGRAARPALAPLVLALAAGLGACSDYDLVPYEGDDSFEQLQASKVDVLLVVDNSCSMQPYQRELGQNFEHFLTYFEDGDVDYQLGVVTTAVSESAVGQGCTAADIAAIPDGGKLVGDGDRPTIITPDTPDGAEVFADIVDVGVCGSGFEMGLESAYRALTPPFATGFNDGFLREDAFLSVIFVSDEEDMSPLGVNDYINAYRSVKGQRERDVFNASSLVITDEDNCSSVQREAGSVGSRYIDVAHQGNGVLGDICAEDFSGIVTDLSLASSRLRDTFFLTKLPEVDSLRVFVDDGDCGGDDEEDQEACEVPCDGSGDLEWVYQLQDGEGNVLSDPDDCDEDCVGAIVFDRANLPPVSSRINVLYNLGDGDPDDFCKGGDE